jgi:SET domain-containing protein
MKPIIVVFIYSNRCSTSSVIQMYRSQYETINGESIGYGVIAKYPIKANTKICEFKGKKMSKKKSKNYKFRVHLNKDCVLCCDDYALCEPSQCIASMINTANGLVCPYSGRILSSEDNNCRLSIVESRAFIYSIREIYKNEELFFPYNFKLN